MQNDRHQTAIPEEGIALVQGKIAECIAALRPYAVALTPQERRDMLKMGDRSLAFVEKAHDYIHDNPALAPSFLDVASFDTDFSDTHGLWNILTMVRQLEEVLSDTVMTAGSEAFHAALAFYHNVQAAAKQDIPGAKAIYEDLRTRFPHGRRGTAQPEA